MKILLLGANGQLGTDLRRCLHDHEVVPITRADLDIENYTQTRAVLTEARPEVVLNTTAYHRVDDCETYPELAYRTNVFAVLNLARLANELDATLVHFSTDYVFDGMAREPYTESSVPFPLSVYGNSKLAGEFVVRSVAKKHIVVRTCGLYGTAGSRGKGGNFVQTMIEKASRGEPIRVVNDQTLTPTYTAELAAQVARVLPAQQYGLLHITNEGSCSWYEFAKAVFELSGIRADLTPTTSDLYKTPAVRPRYSVLENARLKDLGLNQMTDWRQALSAYLEQKSLSG
jgi:dTDP-4-dehydrorhamnose reductase